MRGHVHRLDGETPGDHVVDRSLEGAQPIVVDRREVEVHPTGAVATDRRAGDERALELITTLTDRGPHLPIAYVVRAHVRLCLAQRLQQHEQIELALEDISTGSAPSMIGMDPPVQTKLRKLVRRAFNPKRVAAMEPRIRALAIRFLDSFVEEGEREGECDLIAHFAALLPSDVISTLLGAPPGDHRDLRVWTETLMHREDGVAKPPPAAKREIQPGVPQP